MSFAIVEGGFNFSSQDSIIRFDGVPEPKTDRQFEFPRFFLQVQFFVFYNYIFNSSTPDIGLLQERWAYVNALENPSFKYMMDSSPHYLQSASIMPYFEKGPDIYLLVGVKYKSNCESVVNEGNGYDLSQLDPKSYGYRFFGGGVNGHDMSPIDTALREFREETYGTFSDDECEEIKKGIIEVIFHRRSKTLVYFVKVKEKTLMELHQNKTQNSTKDDIKYWGTNDKFWQETDNFAFLKLSELDRELDKFERNYKDTVNDLWKGKGRGGTGYSTQKGERTENNIGGEEEEGGRGRAVASTQYSTQKGERTEKERKEGEGSGPVRGGTGGERAVNSTQHSINKDLSTENKMKGGKGRGPGREGTGRERDINKDLSTENNMKGGEGRDPVRNEKQPPQFTKTQFNPQKNQTKPLLQQNNTSTIQGTGTTKGDGTGQTPGLIKGDGTGIKGDGTGIKGDGTGIKGDGTGIEGDGTGIEGDGTGIKGDGTGVETNTNTETESKKFESLLKDLDSSSEPMLGRTDSSPSFKKKRRRKRKHK